MANPNFPDLPKIVRAKLISLGAEPGDHCLVAFSGGQDSTALLLATLEGWGRDRLITAAHLDHAVRDGSEMEQASLRQICADLGVEIRTGNLDPEELSEELRRTGSLEAAMRTCRYRFLLSCARSLGTKWLLTGHTADDQVETVLFRICRRMDPMSLYGIPEKRSSILRPLLGIAREVTYRYCMGMGIKPLVDPSNKDYGFTRNRLRYYAIPALQTSFHPDLKKHVLRLSSLVRRMETVKEGILSAFKGKDPDIEKGILSSLRYSPIPDGMRESAIGRFLQAGMGRWPSHSQLREAREHIYGRKRGRMSLPGGKILDSSADRTYIYDDGLNRRLSIPWDPVRLPVPGEAVFEAPGITVTARYGTFRTCSGFPAGNTVLVGRTGLSEPLWVRGRHPGDRFSPLGMSGDKKLKDFFIDRKIPYYERDKVPLVLDNDGKILWVGGIEISSMAAAEGFEGEDVVVLRLDKIGQAAQSGSKIER